MAKAERHAEIDAFIAERHDLRLIRSEWLQWDGRRWRPIDAERVVELFRAHPPPTPEAAGAEANGGAAR